MRVRPQGAQSEIRRLALRLGSGGRGRVGSSPSSLPGVTTALLTPVPLQHLLDGRDVCEREGRVAFGSQAEVLRELDREGGPATRVLIYASHTGVLARPRVSSTASYLRYVESKGGAHPERARVRPSPRRHSGPGPRSRRRATHAIVIATDSTVSHTQFSVTRVSSAPTRPASVSPEARMVTMVATAPAKPTKAKGTSPIRAAQPAAHGRSPPTTPFRGNASSVRMAVQVTAPSQAVTVVNRGPAGGHCPGRPWPWRRPRAAACAPWVPGAPQAWASTGPRNQSRRAGGGSSWATSRRW